MRTTALQAEYPVTVGRRVLPDDWRMTEQLVESDWDKAPFRITTNVRTGGGFLPTKSGYVELAVNVEVTGSKVRRCQGESAVRVRITFIKDDEPNVIHHGWMFVN